MLISLRHSRLKLVMRTRREDQVRTRCIRQLHSAKNRWASLLPKDIATLVYVSHNYPQVKRLKAYTNIVDPLRAVLVERIKSMVGLTLGPGQPLQIAFNSRMAAWQIEFAGGQHFAVFPVKKRSPALWPCAQLVSVPEVDYFENQLHAPLEAIGGEASGRAFLEDTAAINSAARASGLKSTDYCHTICATTPAPKRPLVIPTPPASSSKRRKKLPKTKL